MSTSLVFLREKSLENLFPGAEGTTYFLSELPSIMFFTFLKWIESAKELPPNFVTIVFIVLPPYINKVKN